MQHRIDGNPDFGDLTVALEAGESVLVESGAMSRMSREMDLRTRLPGGFLRALVRKLFGGESFFLGEYTAREGGWIGLAPALPGTVLHERLDGGSLVLTAGSFLACSPSIDIRTRFGGLRSLFSGEGAFQLVCSGRGDLWFTGYGGVHERRLEGGETLRVDTGHVVAWDPSIDYRIRGMGGIKQTLFSGEGLILEFSGRGRIWVQTRNLPATAGWLTPYLFS
jgi:uncharacterized protein (TIGR00266 family)